jgi:Zn-dependent alcohol dehydrogenase
VAGSIRAPWSPTACSLDDINDGIARMRSGEVVHAIVDFRPVP